MDIKIIYPSPIQERIDAWTALRELYIDKFQKSTGVDDETLLDLMLSEDDGYVKLTCQIDKLYEVIPDSIRILG